MTANIFRSIIVALLIPFTFACTGMGIFVANSEAMSGTIPMLVPVLCVLVGVAALLLFLIQLPFFFIKKHWFPLVNTLLLGSGFLLWFQANVFNWNFGELDGGGVNWTAFRHLMVLEIVVYAGIAGFVLWWRKRLNKHAILIACSLMFMQAVPLAKPVAKELISMRTKVAVRHLLGFKTTPKMYEMAKEEVTPKCPEAEPTLNPNIPSWKQYDITYDGFFDYSPEQNVVLIIPDAFGSQLFQRIIKRHPAALEWFSDFNYFPKQKSNDGGTAVNVPQLLTACCDKFLPFLSAKETRRAETIPLLWNAEGALQKTLAESGFQTRLYAGGPSVYHWDHRWISNIRLKGSSQDLSRESTLWDDLIETGIGQVIDLAVVRLLPIACKPADIELFRPIQYHLQMYYASKSAEFKPIQGKDSDVAFVQILNASPVSAKSPQNILQVIHLRGAHLAFNFNENFEYEWMPGIEGFERQGLAAILLMKRLIDDMKKAGVYDNTLIVVAADHGEGNMATYITDGSEYYNPLLLIKRPHERNDAMVYRTEYTEIKDITPTILDTVDLADPSGRFSIFNMPPDTLAQREVKYEASRKKRSQSLQTVVLAKREKEAMPEVSVSSEIVLKKTDLGIVDKRLQFYAGDNLDVWNQAFANKMGIIAMNPEKNEGACYQGSVDLFRVSDHNSGRGQMEYWKCHAAIGLQNVADGEYTVEFLLPKQDGSYARTVLSGTVTVASGTASVVSETPTVATEATTIR